MACRQDPRAFFVLALFVCLSSLSAAVKPWNEFLFVQTWPTSMCIQAQVKGQHRCAIPGNVTTWAVHGLWPTENGTFGPNFCNSTEKFDPSRLKPIQDQLLKYWPNLFVDTHKDDFWQHEWDKHGTCAAELPALDTELAYFTAALKLNRKFDILTFLQKSGVTPTDSGNYKLADIEEALERTIGRKPYLQCFNNTKTGGQHLVQIEICLNKGFEVIECGRRSAAVSSFSQTSNWLLKHPVKVAKAQTGPCSESLPIVYPAIRH